MSDDYFDDDGEIIRTAENHVIWRNAQWVVTEDGYLSARHMSYHLAPKALPALNRTRSWHEHLARKTWVDNAMFWQAFRKACEVNQISVTTEELDHWEEQALEWLDGEPTRTHPPRYDERSDAHYGHWS